MLRDLLSNRLFMGVLVFFVLIIIGGTFYLKQVERQTQQEMANTEAAIKQWNEKNAPPPTGTAQVAEVGDASPKTEDTPQGGHWHGNEWHANPHDPSEQELPEGDDKTTPVDLKRDKPQYAHTPEEFEEVLKWSEGYLSFISKNYSELSAAHQLYHKSEAEFRKRYPTEADIESLRQRGVEMEQEFLKQRREMFRRFPKDKYESILSQLYAEYSQLLGEDTAAAAIKSIRDDVGY